MNIEDKDIETESNAEPEADEADEAPPPRPSRRVGNAQEFIESELVLRAERAQPKLRANLVGTILLGLSDTGEKFLFDWSNDKPKVEKIVSEKSAGVPIDCKINLSAQHFMKIANGDLNPQIGMLSDKIHVEGKLGLAIYVFNLVAPQR